MRVSVTDRGLWVNQSTTRKQNWQANSRSLFGINVMLCYVMLCYVMLCYVMLCYVMLCYVMLCYHGYVMLCFMLRYHTLRYVTSRHVIYYHIILYIYYIQGFKIEFIFLLQASVRVIGTDLQNGQFGAIGKVPDVSHTVCF